MMKLYYSDVLSPRKVCAVAKYLDAPVEYSYLTLNKGEQKKPDYLALNPNGMVPTLVDADRVIWEADAIICHLAQRMGSDLWPAGPARQTEIVGWFSWGAQHLNRAGGALYFENIIRKRFGMGAPDAAEVATAQKDFRRFAKVLDGHLASRKWLVGDTLTAADFSVAMALPYAEAAQMPLDEFAHVRHWHDRLNEIEAWRDPFPAR